MIWCKPNSLSRRHADRWLAFNFGLAALLAGLILLLVVAFLLRESWPVLGDAGLRFFTDDGWYPLEERLGLLPMVWATLAAALGATLLAEVLGVACALFLHFYAPRNLARIVRAMLALLAGIPSVVYGLWGLTVLVPRLAAWQPPGASLLAAILILALMILPTVALTSVAALQAVPATLLQAATALGFTRSGLILGVAVAAARRAMLGGVLLAVARALGETMAVLMVAGNVVQNPTDLFEPVRVLTANIALEMAYATGDHRASLFASGLMLTAMVLLLAWLAARLGREARHG